MAIKFQDYYDVLGVKRDAAVQEIQRAYRQLARKFHPDVNKDDQDAAAKFAQVNEAYEVLKDPDKRKRFDELGANWKAGQEFRPPPGFENIHFEFRPSGGRGGFNFSPSGFSDYFDTLFGNRDQAGRSGARRGFTSGGAGAGAKAKARPREHEVAVTIALERAYHQTPQRVELQTAKGKKTVDVKMPPGLTNGTKIRLAGEGLVLVVHIAAHDRYTVQGHDLVTEVRLSPWEAALGAKVPLQTLDGEVNLTVPPGTSSAGRLRLRDKGLVKRDQTRGDLLATIKIVVPRDLSKREKQLFEQLKDESAFDPRTPGTPGNPRDPDDHTGATT